MYNLLDKQNGKDIPKQTRKNCITALCIDPLLGGKIKFNTLSRRKNVEGGLPWNKSTEIREWTNIDNDYLLSYIETSYGLSSEAKILSALEVVADMNKFNPFADMINSVKWDGVPRIENLLTDYLGAKKDRYSTEVMKILMLGVISRAFCPGTKFDYVIVLTGPQGVGKSTFFYKLCCNPDWYLENLTDIRKNKDAGELLQGKLIIEFNELLAAKGSIEGIKSFTTLTTDEYRPAYKRVVEKYKRTCVFVGTTNENTFLVDKTGNRRFLPIECKVEPITKSLFRNEEELKKEFMQAWAEAYEIYKSGKFSLVLPADLQEEIEKVQEDFKQDDPMIGMIQRWLEDENKDCTCNVEIAKEVFQEECPKRGFLNQLTRIMVNEMPGWKRDGTHRFKEYGQQKCYVKEKDFEPLDSGSLPEEIPFE